jgi:hypothetical protein
MHLLDQREDVPYSAYLLAFSENGMEIRHPYMSECGRFDADPVADYGFEEVQTGGGCTALVKKTADGRELMLTDTSGCSTPDTDQTPVTGLLGLQIEGQTVAWLDLRDIPFESDVSLTDEIMDALNDVLNGVDKAFDAGDRLEMYCRIIREVNVRMARICNEAHL